ncbi:hypothetical protein BGZ89_012716 [Linnemannia elongata]|nr:hypothetical protein BGZ89_012716 [Linnemannia elongata]
MSTALLRLTLFTKTNCGLCTTAKEALTRIPFQLDQIDIYAPGQEAAQKYMFDVPVVELNGRVAMMHRIDEPKLIDILHNAQKSDSQQKK